MSRHLFLSPAWIEAARDIHEEYKDQVEPPSETLRLNVTITDAPFSENSVLGHVDTSNGSAVPDEGHVDNPDVAVIATYAIARQLLIDQQPESVMIAFMSGEIEVEGDITRMLDLQDLEATPEQQALAEEVIQKLTEITE